MVTLIEQAMNSTNMPLVAAVNAKAELSRQSGKCDGLIIHQVWIQGADKLPMEYVRRQALWRAAFPEATFKLWDNETACATWSDYSHVQDSCSAHAMRADLILARALRDFGGLATGTDTQPLWPGVHSLRAWINNNSTLLIVNPSDNACSNGVVVMPKSHPFITAVCAAQLRNHARFHESMVPKITGPGLYYQVLRQRHWALACVTDTLIYNHICGQPVHQDCGWVDPGYAGSWHQ